MIGVIARPDERRVAEEFFELFKTPWEFYCPEQPYEVVLTTGPIPAALVARLVIIYSSKPGPLESKSESGHGTPKPLTLHVENAELPLYGEARVFEADQKSARCITADGQIIGFGAEQDGLPMVRLGYDLFFEIEQLLTVGQPLEHAEKPTLELHIELLRSLILMAGIPLVEIPPVPSNYQFAVCLTHDIDFVGIRRHKFDHTMFGFVLRGTAGNLTEFIRGRISASRLFQSWKAVASLPFVYLGLAKDFWMPFEWYLEVEKGLSPTYFFIPFKGRKGENVVAKNPDRRASGYDISDVPDWAAKLQAAGCELGVHGIDAWHDSEKGRAEREQVSGVIGREAVGIRMHWLLQDRNTCETLENAGYTYDSTAGYNETPGYRCGTVQTFRPLTTRTLLELPLHIQDGALFYAKRLGLTEAEAWIKCETFIGNSLNFGGVLTVLWHDRSFAAERFWGDFYVRLIDHLKTLNVWFASGSELVSWFRARREISFERDVTSGRAGIKIRKNGKVASRAFRIRVHRPATPSDETGAFKRQSSDTAWDGSRDFRLDLPGTGDVGNPTELQQTTVRE